MVSRLLALGVVVCAAAAPTANGTGPEQVSLTVRPNEVTVQVSGEPWMQYRFGGVPFKPYVKDLMTPGGFNVLLDAPSDHLHHHALMFAVAADGVDYWAEAGPVGTQKHLGLEDVRVWDADGITWAGFVDKVSWLAPGDRVPTLKEARSIRVCRLTEPAVTLLCWTSRLELPPGRDKVIISGSHYFGLGMRFVRSMDASGRFLNSRGDPGNIFRGAERLVQADWCAYTVQADGKNVTAAMFGHSSNPRHPTTWFTMAEPFAYLSATLGLHEKPLDIAAGKPLVLRYAVVLWDKQADTQTIESLYKRWTAW